MLTILFFVLFIVERNYIFNLLLFLIIYLGNMLDKNTLLRKLKIGRYDHLFYFICCLFVFDDVCLSGDQQGE